MAIWQKLPAAWRKKQSGEEQENTGKKKLTHKEREKMEQEARAHLPTRSQVGRNGLFEFSGPLSYTHAVGHIPGGPFVAIHAVLHGHNFYVFDQFEGRKPTSKPLAFFNARRAVVTEIGLLQNPPLPPNSNVFKLEFGRKQYGHKDYFFKTSHSRELQKWLKDLTWRAKSSEAQISERFAPSSTVLPRRRMDETETAVYRSPETVLGLVVRYVPKPTVVKMDDVVDLQAAAAAANKKKKAAQKKYANTAVAFGSH